MSSSSTTVVTPPPRGPGRPRSAVRSFIRRRPLLAFFAWFFTVGQAFAFTPVVLEANGVDVLRQPFIIGSTVIGLMVPALVITRIVDGPAAARRLWQRALDFRVGFGWYLLALVAVPVVATAVTVAFLGPPVGVSPAAVGGMLVSVFAWQLLLNMVPNNWAEELAWTGFVQARLQKRHGAARAALVVGPLFALEHISLVFGASLVEGALLIGLLAVLAVPFRFLTGWAHNRTGSVLLVGLIHAAGNAATVGSGFGDGFLRRLYPDSGLPGMAHLLAFAAIGLVVLIATRGRLGTRAGAR